MLREQKGLRTTDLIQWYYLLYFVFLHSQFEIDWLVVLFGCSRVLMVAESVSSDSECEIFLYSLTNELVQNAHRFQASLYIIYMTCIMPEQENQSPSCGILTASDLHHFNIYM